MNKNGLNCKEKQVNLRAQSYISTPFSQQLIERVQEIVNLDSFKST